MIFFLSTTHSKYILVLSYAYQQLRIILLHFENSHRYLKNCLMIYVASLFINSRCIVQFVFLQTTVDKAFDGHLCVQMCECVKEIKETLIQIKRNCKDETIPRGFFNLRLGRDDCAAITKKF